MNNHHHQFMNQQQEYELYATANQQLQSEYFHGIQPSPSFTPTHHYMQSSSHIKDQQKIYSFVPLDVMTQKKRPRKKYNEVERLYQCTYQNCTKAYGTLNHLNAHVSMQGHGPKRLPVEFKELRRQLKANRAKNHQSTNTKIRDSSSSSSHQLLQQSFVPFPTNAATALLPHPPPPPLPPPPSSSSSHLHVYSNTTIPTTTLYTQQQQQQQQHNFQMMPPPF